VYKLIGLLGYCPLIGQTLRLSFKKIDMDYSYYLGDDYKKT